MRERVRNLLGATAHGVSFGWDHRLASSKTSSVCHCDRPAAIVILDYYIAQSPQVPEISHPRSIPAFPTAAFSYDSWVQLLSTVSR